MARIHSIAVAVLSLASTVAVCAQAGRLQGRVTTTEGLGLPTGYLVVHADPTLRAEAPPRNGRLRPDMNAGFAPELAPGFYDVCAIDIGMDAACRKVRIKPNEVTSIVIALAASREITKVSEHPDPLGGSSGPSQSRSGVLDVVVRGAAGELLEGAHVLVHADPAFRDGLVVPSPIETLTDAKGRYRTELAPGFYNVCAMAPTRTAVCVKSRVTVGKTTENALELRFDPQVMKELRQER